MKKLLLIGALLSISTALLGETVTTKFIDQDQLIDQLNIVKIKMDTWLDLSQLDNLLQEGKEIVKTMEAIKTTAAQGSFESKTLIANKNEVRKIMNNVYSIHRRRALPKVTTVQQ